jgi:POT family proton-dependent oligopeptide transporter
MADNNNRKQIVSISVSEVWDRIIYYGLHAVLVLFLIHKLNFTDDQSYDLFSVYILLSFSISIVGGIIADKYLGYFYSVLIGGVLISVGTLVLCNHHLIVIYLGLSIIVVGIGFFKPNNASLLGKVCENDSLNKASIFTLYYMYINVGSLSGPLIYGIFINSFHYEYAFILSSVGMFLSTLYLYRVIGRKNSVQFNIRLFVLIKLTLLIMMLVFMSAFLMYYANSAKNIMLILAAIIIFLASNRLRKLTIKDRLSIVSLVLPLCCCIIYFACFLQIYSSVTLFIDRYVERSLFAMAIPTAWFSSIEPFFLILISPFLSRWWQRRNGRGKEPKDQTKIIIGLLLAALSFLLLTFVATDFIDSGRQSLLLILLANFILAASELCIIPVTMVILNSAAPKQYKSTVMGLFYFSFAFSGYLANFVAKISTMHHEVSRFSFAYSFSSTSLILIVTALVAFILNRILIKHLVTAG